MLIEHLQCTVVLVTHRLDEAEQLCNRVAIMRQGQLVACGPTAEVKRSLNITPEYALQVRHLSPVSYQQLQELSDVEDVEWVQNDSDISELNIRMLTPPDTLPTVLQNIMLHGGEIQRCHLREPSLEDAFVTILEAPSSSKTTQTLNAPHTEEYRQIEKLIEPATVDSK